MHQAWEYLIEQRPLLADPAGPTVLAYLTERGRQGWILATIHEVPRLEPHGRALVYYWHRQTGEGAS